MNGTVRRRVAALRLGALVAAGALMLAACGSSSGSDPSSETSTTSDASMTEDTSSTPETVALSIGVIPILDVAPIYLGIEQGFFADEGLDVTLETAQGGAAIVPGVVSGQFQFGFSNVVSLLLAQSNGLDIKVVASGVASTGEDGADFGAVLVPEGSDIQSAADLAGKRIAVNTLQNINTTTINKVVSDAGGDPSTIEYVELAFPDIVPAIVAGDVDAGQVVEPFLTIGQGQGLRQVVSNYAATDPNLEVGAYFTSGDYIAQHPDVVERFTKAMNTSLEYADANPDAARAILATYTSMDEATQQAVTLPRWPTEISTESVQLLADLAVQDGMITGATPDVAALLP
ncbi:ABC transporter substrate-binding protein [Actinotalea sp. M2MS4P-6]|uniref:ABC transporter substrate-binding protein n=1 Tax=Actinotalea sp. M2MS4P-6 TaxID=2983762 RepID=UPI0021E42878|nr:ABC transporter substrate-binding protein [Actinotalea sp. M2MS4P-6]MCV2394332.1 ABC transporter substrate-binding protein [Actinotalea sp. M2MS4P-6]